MNERHIVEVDISPLPGKKRIVIPEGWRPVEEGTWQAGDQYLIGGKTNAWALDTRWREIEKESIGGEISSFALAIRKQ